MLGDHNVTRDEGEFMWHEMDEFGIGPMQRASLISGLQNDDNH